MSPRRKLEPVDETVVVAPNPKRLRQFNTGQLWGLLVAGGVAALLIAGSITVGALILHSHKSHHDASVRDAVVLGYVRQFMIDYTTLDPLHANDYADRVVDESTGDFAKQYNERMNEIVVQVARAEPTTGSVLEAGIEKWHDDGTVSVLVATKLTSAAPDGKSVIENGNRWVVTAAKEGEQWKISQLIEVI